MRRAVVGPALVVVCALTIGACGVPADDGPREIPAGQVPFDLLAPSTSQPETTLPVMTVPATVFVLGPERLVPVTRSIARPPSLGAVLATLIQGPTDAEASAGLRSAVNPQTAVLSSQVVNGTAVVNVSEAFSGIATSDQILALAQLVWTATALPDVTSVQVVLNSVPVEVPRGDGSTTSQALRRNDYAGLAPSE